MKIIKSSNHRILERSAAEAVAYKSAAVLAPIAGVLGGLLSKNQTKVFRTDKVSSLETCTHRPFAKVCKPILKHHF